MTALESFNLGFLDGYRGTTRRKNLGSDYLRAYRRGAEARERDLNGGEDTSLPRTRVPARLER